MDESKAQGGNWDDAVSQASNHVESRNAAEQEAADRQKPRADGWKIAVAFVILIAVVAWNVQSFTSELEAPPLASEEEHLAWFVVDAVEAVEDFRTDEGHLPNAQEALELLEDDVTYQLRGDQYTIAVEGDEGRVVYDGSVPIDDWIAAYSTGGGVS